MVRASIAIVIGFVSGIASGALGIGGAMLSTPGIRVFLETGAKIAVGTTLPVIIPAALTGVLTYRRGGFVDLRVAAIAASAGTVFAALGALTTDVVPGEALLVGTAALILVLAVRMLPQRGSDGAPSARTGVPLYLAAGAVSGFLSGLLGIGGGIVLVPFFTGVLRLPVKTALGTSLAVVAAQSVPGTIVHSALRHIDWTIAAGLSVGVIPGAWAGSRLAVAARDDALRVVVAVGLAALAVAFGWSELRRLV